MIIDIG